MVSQGPGGFGVGWVTGPEIPGYKLEGQIGQGGMAVVFRAVDQRLGRRVALKVLAPTLAADEGFRQRFVRESRTAAAVDDPHIIPIYEAGEAAGALYIAMRYVPGGDARTLLRREGLLSPPRAAAIISAVASALDAAHAAGLAHRDVKPANMLLDARAGRPDHVYLSDFGLSKAWQGSTALTGSGLFLGTLDYSAPEQIEGREVDGRADQYALACTAFELLAGEPPFRRDQGLAVMYAQLSAPPPPLTQRRPGLDPSVDEVLARALAKSPDQRYPTCGQFARELRGALGLSPYDADNQSMPPPSRTATAIASYRPADQDGRPGSRHEGTNQRDHARTVTGIPASSPDRHQPDPSVYGPLQQIPGPGTSPKKAHTRILLASAAAAILAAVAVGGLLATHHTPSTPQNRPTAGRTPAGHPAKTPSGSPAVPLTHLTVCTYPADGCTGFSARYATTKPARIITSADGSGYVENLAWRGWGSAEAQGSGVLEVDNCNPNCAQGTYTGYPATVTLSRPTAYGNGKLAYAHMTVSAPTAPYPEESFTTGLVP
jgi:serine/threonine protein kinase